MQDNVRGLTFVANVEGERYAGRISDEIVADHIAHACGENGSCAEYLLETVLKCEELGIHDHFLWRLRRNWSQNGCALMEKAQDRPKSFFLR